MIHKKQNTALELTREILNQYWAGNQELLIKYMHPEILWIGSTNSEYIHGSEEMIRRIHANKTEMPMVYLDDQEYEIVHSEGQSCLIVGRYRAYTKPESGVLLSERQRVSFLWVRDNTAGTGQIRIKHIHLSNVLKTQGEDEFFPTREGKKNLENMKKIVAERVLGKTVIVKDTHQVTRVFNYTEVVYLRADRNYTEFYTSGQVRVARVRENLSKYKEELPENFLQVSRSVLVNRDYVKQMKGKVVTMLDDTKIQVPAARCTLIREALKVNKK